MNVSTSSAASTASTSDVSSTQSQAKTNSTSSTDKSFEDEIKTASKAEDSVETSQKQDNTKDSSKVSDKNSSKDNNKLSQDIQDSDDIISSDIYSGSVNFTDYKYGNESQSLLSQNIQNLLNTKDLMNTVNSASTINYDALNMSADDANFFANLVQNTDMSMQNLTTQFSESMLNNSETVQRNIQVSSLLMEKLSDSMRTNQPFRIDFDKDVSVILKVNKDGSLAASFIPGDKAVEDYLRNNISTLRQKFDNQKLPYSELSYSNSRRQQQEKRKDKEK